MPEATSPRLDTAMPEIARRAMPWSAEILAAAVVAVMWLYAFARSINAHLFREEAPALGFAVYIIYGTDKAFDLLSPARKESKRLALVLLLLWFFAGLALAAASALYLPKPVFIGALMPALLVVCRFALVWLSRQPWPGPLGVGVMCMLLAVGLVQGTSHRPILPQLWRGVYAGVLITVMYFALRGPAGKGPWRLPVKAFDGWLFALGVALIPYTHLSDSFPDPDPMLTGPAVLLFAAAVMLNSLVISLRRSSAAPALEIAFLSRAIPWLALTGAAGAWAESTACLPREQPLFYGIAAAFCGVGAVQLNAGRFSPKTAALLADAAVFAGGIIALLIPFGT